MILSLAKNNPNGSRLWEPAEKEKLRDLFFEGYTDDEIAEMLERTPGAVAGMRGLLKLRKSKQGKRDFVLHDAMGEYLPKWYVDLKRKQWNEKYGKASIR
jgi:hypothetical protein